MHFLKKPHERSLDPLMSLAAALQASHGVPVESPSRARLIKALECVTDAHGRLPSLDILLVLARKFANRFHRHMSEVLVLTPDINDLNVLPSFWLESLLDCFFFFFFFFFLKYFFFIKF
jgi:hypothetical protein